MRAPCIFSAVLACLLSLQSQAAVETSKWQSAIDAVAAKGGGRVTVGPGVHVVGTLWLRSNVELHLERKAVLKASTDPKDYNALDAFPENFSSKTENWVGRHLILAREAENVSITGEGVIDGNGEEFFERRVWAVDVYGRRDKMRGDEPSAGSGSPAWRQGIRWSKDWNDPRPGQMVEFVRCRNVRVEGVGFRDATCWNLFFYGCDDVVARDLVIRAPSSSANTDGIDIDCCRRVTVERCDISVGDDAITFRGSEQRLGEKSPCDGVTVRNCTLACSSAVFRFGVGTGLVRNVLIENCRAYRGCAVLDFTLSYEGRGGCDVENVTVRNVVAEGCAVPEHRTAMGATNTFGVRNVTIENCDFARSPAGYGVTVNGRSVKVHKVRQSAQAYNWWWSGLQRSVSQTEEAAFASVESAGPVDVEVKLPRDAKAPLPTVRPLRHGVAVTVEGDVARFRLPGPGQYVFEPDATRHHALALFVNPPRTWNEKWTHRFGPGEHYVGTVNLKSGDRVYVDAEAVVHGNFVAQDVTDAKICGYGVVDAGCYDRVGDKDYHAHPYDVSNLAFYRSRNVRVEGPVFVDSALWCVATFDCDDIVFDRIKLVGEWRYNTDGIDLCNSRNVTVKDSFVHAFDDALVVKGLAWKKERPPVADVLTTNCVLWCDWGRTCEVGIETWAETFRNVAFLDCDCIHNSAVALDIQAGGDTAVEDVTFRDIRVEFEKEIAEERLQSRWGEPYPGNGRSGNPYLWAIDNHKPWPWSCKEKYSDVRNVTIDGITVYLAPNRRKPPTYLCSVDPSDPRGQLGHKFPFGDSFKQPGVAPRDFENVVIGDVRFEKGR